MTEGNRPGTKKSENISGCKTLPVQEGLKKGIGKTKETRHDEVFGKRVAHGNRRGRRNVDYRSGCKVLPVKERLRMRIMLTIETRHN